MLMVFLSDFVWLLVCGFCYISSGRKSRGLCSHPPSHVFSCPSNGAQIWTSRDEGLQHGGQPPSGADAPLWPLRSGVRRAWGALRCLPCRPPGQAGKHTPTDCQSCGGSLSAFAFRLSLQVGRVPRRCLDLRFKVMQVTLHPHPMEPEGPILKE